MSKTLRHAVITMMCLLAFTILLAVTPAFAGSNSLMITQFSSVGGQSSGLYNVNFVEVYNAGTSTIDLTDPSGTSPWTIQFQTTTGTITTSTSYYLGGTHGGNTVTYNNSFNGQLKPGQYMLIQTQATGSTGVALPITADLVITNTTKNVAGGTSTMGSIYGFAGGQIALVNSASPMTCTGSNPHGSTPDPVADYMSFQYNAATPPACFEGGSYVTIPSSSAAKKRGFWRGPQSINTAGSNGGTTGPNPCGGDTDNNNLDFKYVSLAVAGSDIVDQTWQLHSSAKVWKYSGSAFAASDYNAYVCGAAEANPAHVLPGESTTFSVTIAPTAISVAPFTVTADLSQFGLSAATPLTDDGSGTRFVSATQTIPNSQTLKTYFVPFTGADSAGSPATVYAPSLPFLVGTPAAATLTASNVTTSYGKTPRFMFTVAPGPCTVTGQPTYTVTDGNGTVLTQPYPVTTDTPFTITPSNALSPDCNFTYATGTLTITKGTQAAASIKCPNSGNPTYTGAPQVCTASSSKGTCDPLSYSSDGGSTYTLQAPTAMGTYIVHEAGSCVSTDPNYMDPGPPADVTMTIGQGVPVVKVTCNNVDFDGSPKACSPGATAYTYNNSGIVVDGTAALTYTGITDPTYGPTANPPTNPGDYSVAAVFTPTDTTNWAGGATGSGTLTILNAVSKPVADPQSITVAANSTNNAITLSATNNPTSFTAGAAANGTVNCTGAACTYTPNAGFQGADSFTFTASNADGTSDPATVSITVTTPVAATLTAPTTGTVLAGKTATFTWTAGTLVSKYMLYVGTKPGTPDDFYSGETTSTTLNVNGLRSTDGKIYVRLYSWIPSLNGWQSSDYVFDYNAPAAATLTGPISLSGSSATFTWTPGSQVTKYMLYVGTAQGKADDFYSGEVTSTSLDVNGLRSTDGNIYVRLYSWFDGGWHFNDYTFTYATPAAATLTSPLVSVSGKSATFTWTAGTLVTKYMLYVGTTPGVPDDFYSGEVTSTSLNVNGLRSTDGNIYVRLYSWYENGWHYNDYTLSYTPAVTPVAAVLTAPTTISGTTAEFTFTAGTGIDHYMLYVGTQPGVPDNYYSGPTTQTDIVVNGLRTTDGNIYVRLYSWATDHWLFHDYVIPVQ